MIPYVEDFLSEEEAAALFALAQSLPRERPLTKMSGFKYRLRRLQMPCYSVTPNWRGSENEKTNQWMMPLDKAPAEIKSLAEKLSKLAGKPVNYFSFVGYENEKDHIGWHQHGEDKCRDARVFIVSLGEVRTFGIRKLCDECRVCDDCNKRMCDGETQSSCSKCKQAHKHRKTCKVCNDKSKWTLLQPAHGSLITLPDSYNNTHEHAVLVDKGPKGFRVSINTKHISSEDMAAGNGYIPKEHRHGGPTSKNAIVVDRPPFVREPGPPRIYCQRKGYDYPPDAVNVDRRTIFGNHKKLNGDEWLAEVASLMKSPEFAAKVEALRGKDLLCWCRPSEESHCHARAWLELANGQKS